MRTIARLFFLVPALALGTGFTLFAQQPRTAPNKGTVLILQNQRTMEGNIQKNGDHYLIRRGDAEVTILGAQVLRLCVDWNDAIAYMMSQSQLADADERLRLARWCHANNQLEEALIQAQAALELRPNHLESKQLVTIFKRAVEAPRPQSVMAPAATPVAAVEPPAALDINNETLSAFSARVQPILLNTCSQCHSNNRGGNFHLSRPFGSNQRSVSQRNLAAALAFVDMKNPRSSPLLVKALSLHGNLTQAPLKTSKSIPFQALQEWVDLVVTTNPHLQERKWTPPTLVAPSVSTEPRLDKTSRLPGDAFASGAVVISHNVNRVDNSKAPFASQPQKLPGTPVGNPAFAAQSTLATPRKEVTVSTSPAYQGAPQFPAPLPPTLASVTPIQPVLGDSSARSTPAFPHFATAPQDVKAAPTPSNKVAAVPPQVPTFPTDIATSPTAAASQTPFATSPSSPTVPAPPAVASPSKAPITQVTASTPALPPTPAAQPSPMTQTPQANPADTYDPTPFNRAMHPDR